MMYMKVKIKIEELTKFFNVCHLKPEYQGTTEFEVEGEVVEEKKNLSHFHTSHFHTSHCRTPGGTCAKSKYEDKKETPKITKISHIDEIKGKEYPDIALFAAIISKLNQIIKHINKE